MPKDTSEPPQMISEDPSSSCLLKRLDSDSRLCVLLGILPNNRMNSHQINTSMWQFHVAASEINFMRQFSEPAFLLLLMTDTSVTWVVGSQGWVREAGFVLELTDKATAQAWRTAAGRVVMRTPNTLSAGPTVQGGTQAWDSVSLYL